MIDLKDFIYKKIINNESNTLLTVVKSLQNNLNIEVSLFNLTNIKLKHQNFRSITQILNLRLNVPELNWAPMQFSDMMGNYIPQIIPRKNNQK